MRGVNEAPAIIVENSKKSGVACDAIAVFVSDRPNGTELVIAPCIAGNGLFGGIGRLSGHRKDMPLAAGENNWFNGLLAGVQARRFPFVIVVPAQRQVSAERFNDSVIGPRVYQGDPNEPMPFAVVKRALDVPHDHARPMGCDEFLSRQFDGFSGKPSLPSCNERQNDRESRDEDRRDRGHGTVVRLQIVEHRPDRAHSDTITEIGTDPCVRSDLSTPARGCASTIRLGNRGATQINCGQCASYRRPSGAKLTQPQYKPLTSLQIIFPT